MIENPNIIQIEHLCKKFKDEIALQDITVSFEKGKIYGLIGRNGSGKTVLLKCICGFMKPTSGCIIVDGQRVIPSVTQDIGIIIEEPGFIGAEGGFKNLQYLASVYGKVSNEEIRETIRKVGLDPDDKKAVRKYSLGMRHRLGIAQAIMEKPKILLLDEPMNGLDHNGVIEIRELFRQLRATGTTIIIASHYVEDIDTLCDSVYEMERGTLTKKK